MNQESSWERGIWVGTTSVSYSLSSAGLNIKEGFSCPWFVAHPHRLPCGTSYFIDTSVCGADDYAALISDHFIVNIANTACFRPSRKTPKCWKSEAPMGITEHGSVLPFLETDL